MARVILIKCLMKKNVYVFGRTVDKGCKVVIVDLSEFFSRLIHSYVHVYVIL